MPLADAFEIQKKISSSSVFLKSSFSGIMKKDQFAMFHSVSFPYGNVKHILNIMTDLHLQGEALTVHMLI